MVSSFHSMERLVRAVQDLSSAKDLSAVQAIVRTAARELTGADGATFILRDGDLCHYVDEDAIGPLWKGRKFPMQHCVSGWVMTNKTHAAIEDIFSDERVPVDAYRPTFVKSMVMVPIRSGSPIGAIGNYWACQRAFSVSEISLLQALADTTATAMANLELYEKLNAQVAELERANYELNRFAWVASHDLQEPLRTVSVYTALIEREIRPTASPSVQEHCRFVIDGAKRLQSLISDLLSYSQLQASKIKFTAVESEAAARQAVANLTEGIAEAGASITVGELPVVLSDNNLLTAVFQNLIANAIKFRKPECRIDVTAQRQENGWKFCVRDNGIGVAPQYHQRIFGFFERLHPQDQYQGSGIGLATCKKIVETHGGSIWVESEVDRGAAFFFILADRQPRKQNA